jgi:hypothetical protein
VAWLTCVSPVVVHAHSGPPYPIVTERVAGPYIVEVWADPDVTDDGSAAGQFWVVVRTATTMPLPADTRGEVTIHPSDRGGADSTRQTEPVKGDRARQYAALVMDHEGPFAVHVRVDGPLGRADLDAKVDATYDTRPAPALMVVFLAPFLLVGFLWTKQLLRRRGRTRTAT